MRYTIVSIFDHKAQVFSRPAFVPSIGVAVRSFTEEVNRPGDDNMMAKYSEDFQLHHLGWFDDETGNFEDNPSDLPLVNASTVRVSSV